MSTYSPIASQTLGSAAASVTFSSIPQGYTDLIIVFNGLVSNNTAAAWVQFNSDSGTNYSWTRLSGNGTTAASSRSSGTAGTSNWYGGSAEGLSNTNNNTVILQIQNYANSTTHKTWISRTTGVGVETSVGLWRNTAAITSITLGMETTRTYSADATFSLYGIAGGDVTNKAVGGIVTTSGGYVYHTFTSSGRFIPSENLTADILVVAGGGGAGGYFSSGYRGSGGGGAGGLLSFTSQNLIKNTGYGVTVGAGGAGGYRNTSQAASGTNSQFGTLTTVIGGGFGVNQYVAGEIPGGNGGSGGGGAFTAGGTATSGQGNNGGSSTGNGSGGGGGAGAAGASTTNNDGGNGGTGGTSSLINDIGTAVGYAILSSGNYYFAGGGGGGKYDSGTQGTGGIGGGGAAGNNSAGTSGTANTGGGGGAASYQSGQGTVNATGGSGGSGIVIVRYAV